MSEQKDFLDYVSGGDTGENLAEAIQPLSDGEGASQTTLRRPSENLRSRTEIVRQGFEDLFYYRDVQHLVISSSSAITWAGLPTGTITQPADLYIRPFLTPRANTQGSVAIGTNGVNEVSYEIQSGAYASEGMNRITVEHRDVSGATHAAAITEGPIWRIVVTFDSADVSHNSAATVGLVNTAIAGVSALSGKILAVDNGVGGNAIAAQAETRITGTADLEEHRIPASRLDSVTGTTALQEGDTLAIWYQYLIDPGLSLPDDPKDTVPGGRREANAARSSDEIPEAAIFIAQDAPEKLQGAIPLCRVVDGDLVWINGQAQPGASTITLGSVAADSSPVDTGSFQGATDLIIAGGLTSTDTLVQTALNTIDTRLGQRRAVTYTVSDGTSSTGGDYNGATALVTAEAALGITEGGVLHVRRGTYTVSSALTISDNVAIEGETPNYTIIQLSAPVSITLLGDARLENLTINTNGNALTLTVGTSTNHDAVLRNVKLVGTGITLNVDGDRCTLDHVVAANDLTAFTVSGDDCRVDGLNVTGAVPSVTLSGARNAINDLYISSTITTFTISGSRTYLSNTYIGGAITTFDHQSGASHSTVESLRTAAGVTTLTVDGDRSTYRNIRFGGLVSAFNVSGDQVEIATVSLPSGTNTTTFSGGAQVIENWRYSASTGDITFSATCDNTQVKDLWFNSTAGTIDIQGDNVTIEGWNTVGAVTKVDLTGANVSVRNWRAAAFVTEIEVDGVNCLLENVNLTEGGFFDINANGTTIRNVRNTPTTRQPIEMDLNSVSDCEISNYTASNSDAIFLDASGCTNLTVRNCNFSDISTTSNAALDFTQLKNCVFENITLDTVVSSNTAFAALRLTDSGGSTDRCTYNNIYIDSSWRRALWVAGEVYDVSFNNSKFLLDDTNANTASAGTEHGVVVVDYLTANHKQMSFNGCTFDNSQNARHPVLVVQDGADNDLRLELLFSNCHFNVAASTLNSGSGRALIAYGSNFDNCRFTLNNSDSILSGDVDGFADPIFLFDGWGANSRSKLSRCTFDWNEHEVRVNGSNEPVVGESLIKLGPETVLEDIRFINVTTHNQFLSNNGFIQFGTNTYARNLYVAMVNVATIQGTSVNEDHTDFFAFGDTVADAQGVHIDGVQSSMPTGRPASTVVTNPYRFSNITLYGNTAIAGDYYYFELGSNGEVSNCSSVVSPSNARAVRIAGSNIRVTDCKFYSDANTGDYFADTTGTIDNVVFANCLFDPQQNQARVGFNNSSINGLVFNACVFKLSDGTNFFFASNNTILQDCRFIVDYAGGIVTETGTSLLYVTGTMNDCVIDWNDHEYQENGSDQFVTTTFGGLIELASANVSNLLIQNLNSHVHQTSDVTTTPCVVGVNDFVTINGLTFDIISSTPSQSPAIIQPQTLVGIQGDYIRLNNVIMWDNNDADGRWERLFSIQDGDDTQQLTLENCMARNCRLLYMEDAGAETMRNLKIANCSVYEGLNTGFNAIDLDRVDESVIITGCDFELTAPSGSRVAIRIRSEINLSEAMVVIANCTASSSGSDITLLDTNTKVNTLSGCWVLAGATDIARFAEGNSVANNSITLYGNQSRGRTDDVGDNFSNFTTVRGSGIDDLGYDQG